MSMTESTSEYCTGEIVLSEVESSEVHRATVILPHAGGDPYAYRPLAKLIPDSRVVGVVYPGRLTQEPAANIDLVRIARDFADSFAWTAYDEVTIFGHSMGGLVAHALCAELERRAYKPHRVIVSSTRAPLVDRRVERLPTDPVDILDHIVALGGTPQELVDSEWFRETYVPIIAADYDAVNSYMSTPQPVLDTDLELYVSDRDPSLTITDMCAWHRCTNGTTTTTTFSGDHFYLFDDPAGVAEIMSRPSARKETQNDQHIR